MTDARSAPPIVSIVVPAKNEAGSIPGLVEEVEGVLAGRWPFEMIFVNDGSTDASEATLAGLMPTRPWLRQLKHSRSCGKSAALLTGTAAARSPLIVTIDGDGQNDPVYLPAMIEALQSGPRTGLVAGQRLDRKASSSRKAQSRIANAIRAGMLRDGTRDSGCGYKAFRRDVFLALPFFDGLHRFLPALVRRDGYDVRYVEVVDRERMVGASHYGFWDRLAVGIPDLLGVWWLILRRQGVPQAEEVVSDAHRPR